jgi:hypothetical protein
MGKLRRLEDLTLNLFNEGRFYLAVAQGLAVAGGDRPLPRLWRLAVVSGCVTDDADLLASLLLPMCGSSARSTPTTNRPSSRPVPCGKRATGTPGLQT